MPARNGTGPNGQGARSGRGLGNFRGPEGPGDGNRQRRGKGCGRGFGHCRNRTVAGRGNARFQTQPGDLQAAVENN